MKSITLLFALLLATLTIQAQQLQPINWTVSEVEVYDQGNGYAIIEVRISGDDAATIASGTVHVSGTCIPGGAISTTLADSRLMPGPGNPSNILTAGVPVLPNLTQQPEFVDITLEIQGQSIVIGNKTRKDAISRHFRN